MSKAPSSTISATVAATQAFASGTDTNNNVIITGLKRSRDTSSSSNDDLKRGLNPELNPLPLSEQINHDHPMSPQSASLSAALADLDAQLKAVYQERQEILAGTHKELLEETKVLKERYEQRLKLANDQRVYHLIEVEATFKSDVQRAWDCYYAGRAKLRDSVLRARLEREKRMDLLTNESLRTRIQRKREMYSPETGRKPMQAQRVFAPASPGTATAMIVGPPGVVQPPPPRSSPLNSPKGVAVAGPSTPFGAGIAPPDQGMAGVGRLSKFIALTPDEVQHDMEVILRSVEMSRNIPAQPYNVNQDIVPVIHATHGRLFLFDEIYEKGSLVTVSSKAENFRFNARITAIHTREIQLVATNGKQFVVQLSHLRSGKTYLKRRSS